MSTFESGPVQPTRDATKASEHVPLPLSLPDGEAETAGANDPVYINRPPIVFSKPEPDVPTPVPVHAPGNPFRSGEGVTVLPQALTRQESANKPTLEPSFGEWVATGLKRIFKRKDSKK
jgi:hypothetical protein